MSHGTRLLAVLIFNLSDLVLHVSASCEREPCSKALPSQGMIEIRGLLVDEQATDKHKLTAAATTILNGMIKAFLARPELPEDELRCTQRHIGSFARDLLKASEQTVMELSAMLEPLGIKDQNSKDNITKPKEKPLPAISNGLATIIHLQGKLADACKEGRSLDAFNLAEHHLRNLSYVGGHLVANGADIIPELKDALKAFADGKFRTFGEDIGRAWRKVLLSKISDLPENKKALQLTSQGLVEGFLSSDVHIVGKHNGGHEVIVDLHRCINGQNERFFQEVWDAAWLFFEKVASISPESDQRWKAVLAVVLADLPDAVRYCGFDKAQEARLVQVMKTLQKLRFRVDAKHRTVHTSEVSVDLAQAVDHWTHKKWSDFGKDLGKLLQELVVLVFVPSYSQEYSVESIARQPAPVGMTQLLFICLAGAVALISATFLLRVVARGTMASRSQDIRCEPLATSDIEDGDAENARMLKYYIDQSAE